jgi:hypothetical protein
MSLYIDTDKITEVLLTDGEWYEVEDGSFDLDSYEMHWDGRLVLPGGAVDGIPATGFTFKTPYEGYIYGPLTSVVAVRTPE